MFSTPLLPAASNLAEGFVMSSILLMFSEGNVRKYISKSFPSKLTLCPSTNTRTLLFPIIFISSLVGSMRGILWSKSRVLNPWAKGLFWTKYTSFPAFWLSILRWEVTVTSFIVYFFISKGISPKSVSACTSRVSVLRISPNCRYLNTYLPEESERANLPSSSDKLLEVTSPPRGLTNISAASKGVVLSTFSTNLPFSCHCWAYIGWLDSKRNIKLIGVNCKIECKDFTIIILHSIFILGS